MDVSTRLSFRDDNPDKYGGELEHWERAQKEIKDVADEIRELGEDFSIKYGISPNEHQITEDDLAEDRSLN